MNVEAKSSSSGSCGKFIEVEVSTLMLMVNAALNLVNTASIFVNTDYTSLVAAQQMLLFVVTTAWYRLLLLVIFSAALHGWYYMVFATTVGKEYDKVFNHLDMLHAPLEGKSLEGWIGSVIMTLKITCSCLYGVDEDLQNIAMCDFSYGAQCTHLLSLKRGEAYDKVFNHLDMFHAPLEGKVLILTTAKSLLLLLV
ncbi:hypothetical protein Tco_0581985 [Tanacetum coccineum]